MAVVQRVHSFSGLNTRNPILHCDGCVYMVRRELSSGCYLLVCETRTCSGQAQLLDGLIIVTAEHNHQADVQVVYSITHSSDKDSSNLHCGGYVYAFHESLKPFGSSWVCERSDCRGQAHLLKDVVSVTTVHSHGQLDAENIYEVGSNKPTKRQCQEVGALG